jgi:hypothetical protein
VAEQVTPPPLGALVLRSGDRDGVNDHDDQLDQSAGRTFASHSTADRLAYLGGPDLELEETEMSFALDEC